MPLDKPVPRLPSSLAVNPEHWRERGEEIRVLREDMKDPRTRAMMLKIAEDYERLAGCFEIPTDGDKTDR